LFVGCVGSGIETSASRPTTSDCSFAHPTYPHMLQPSFTFVLCFAWPTQITFTVRLDVPSRATNTASCISHPTVPQSYSDASSSTLSTVHTIGCQAKRLQRPSSVSTATIAIAGTRRTLTVSSTTTPSASLGLIADPGQLHAEIRSYSELMIVDRRGRVLLSFSTQGFYPSSHDPTQAGTPLPTSSSHLKAVPPSIERSFQAHLTQRTIQRGHANNNTLTKCPLDRPTFTRFHQSPPKRPQATPQVKVNPPPRSRRSSSTSIAPPSPAPTRPPR